MFPSQVIQPFGQSSRQKTFSFHFISFFSQWNNETEAERRFLPHGHYANCSLKLFIPLLLYIFHKRCMNMVGFVSILMTCQIGWGHSGVGDRLLKKELWFHQLPSRVAYQKLYLHCTS